MNNELNIFIDRYVKEIQENNAALFIGAGFSKSSGYVNWKQLLESVAYELELDIEKEHDLVSMAQYHFNKNRNRSIINQIISDEFSDEKEISENHKIISRLPIFTYWTTNYDSLIEDSLELCKRIVDVKHSNKQLSMTKARRDAIVYKMHGDKDNPDDTIILKDDYEGYYRKHAPFITALSGDLISKTFLFLGFSFSDPNIDYILSRIRIEYGTGNDRQHYALMRKIKESDYKDVADYEYALRKHQFFIDDLRRYNIKAILIDEYSEITNILQEIEKRINNKNIFLSGSAEDYGIWDREEASKFISHLSKRLIQEGYNLISGFGLGVGSFVITGALEEIYMKGKTINNDRLLLRPFPQGIENEDTRNRLWSLYREDMISRAGIAIFLFGNKTKNEEIILADGMLSEFAIAKEKGNIIIPVASTGFIAEQIWWEINNNISTYYPKIKDEFLDCFYQLKEKKGYMEIIDIIIKMINALN